MVSKLWSLKQISANDSSGKILNCNVHTCPSRCHQLQDHSKMECQAIVATVCPKGHKFTRKCYDKAAVICRKCEATARAAERRRQRDHKLDQERSEKQEAYARKLAEIEHEIEHEKRLLKNQAEEEDRHNAILQKNQDLANLKARKSSALSKPALVLPTVTMNETGGDTPKTQHTSGSPRPSKSSPSDDKPTSKVIFSESEQSQPIWGTSEAKNDWEWQKQYEGAENEALDSLMAMTGLFR
jgi:hypothetical protein